MKWILRIVTILILAWCMTFVVNAMPSDSTRTYNKEHPLVYEDVWDLWPYSYLNEQGEPEGFNIDLIRMMLNEMKIPYTIKLKQRVEAFRDLKQGRSDLMLGLAVGFHDEFGRYSKNAVTLFTQSLVRPKNKPLRITRFHDLSEQKVIVNDSSLAHHLMIEYGWGANAQPVEDMREAIQSVSAKEEGQIVWNTLSLKWLMRRYHTDNLDLTPVNMQHGQYKFMSNNQHLLDMLDNTYTKLYAEGRITPLHDKWFYPERINEQNTVKPWIWWTTGISSLLILLISVYGITFRVQAGKLRRQNKRQNNRLSLILETSSVHIWTYDVASQLFAWRSNNGKIAHTYSSEEFAKRYSAEDFARLMEALDMMAQQNGGLQQDLTLQLKAKDTESGDEDMRDYDVVLSVMSRDAEGKPSVIIGTKKDVTMEHRRQQALEERTLRYWSIYRSEMVGLMLFDAQGRLKNLNPKAAELLKRDISQLLDASPSMDDLLHTGEIDLAHVDGNHGSLKDDVCMDYQLITVNGEQDTLLGVIAVCYDRSDAIRESRQLQEAQAEHQTVSDLQQEYEKDIDEVLEEDELRMVKYSPKEHLLTIFRNADTIQHALTQTRCMTLVDNRSTRQAMRMLNDMDGLEDGDIHAHIHTVLRAKGRRQLCLDFHLMPIHDKEGRVTEYVGLCNDTSEQCEMTMEMERQTAKVQEVENTKNSFVRNMVQEIKRPMDTVTGFVAQLKDRQRASNEEELEQGILQNSDYLLHLIDNILYLSRLEAGMVEIKKQPCNIAEIFGSLCEMGWHKYKNDETKYVVDSPYTQLTVDIDSENLGHAIEQLTANAAQHTKSGTVRARYEYIGRRLVISIDDTGEGIPQQELLRLQSHIGRTVQNSKGLGLKICHELVSQMGGTIDINSEEGSGTTVYITIPCHASEMKRKREGGMKEQKNEGGVE